MSAGRPTLVVVGGGIAGLAAAWEATRGAEVDVTVLEADDRLGGRIRTSDVHGLTIDEGADAFLARVPWGIELCRELDLADDLVSPAARNAFIYSRGDLRPLPTTQVLGVPLDLDELAGTGIVSDTGLTEARRAIEAAGPETTDDTIAAVLERQVGAEVAARLVDPLIGGINAGDTTRLSLRAVVPQLADAAEHPDGLVAGLRELRSLNPPDPTAPVFYGLPEGSGRLIEVLGRRLEDAGATIRTSSPVTALSRTADGAFRLAGRRRGRGDRPRRPCGAGHGRPGHRRAAGGNRPRFRRRPGNDRPRLGGDDHPGRGRDRRRSPARRQRVPGPPARGPRRDRLLLGIEQVGPHG